MPDFPVEVQMTNLGGTQHRQRNSLQWVCWLPHGLQCSAFIQCRTYPVPWFWFSISHNESQVGNIRPVTISIIVWFLGLCHRYSVQRPVWLAHQTQQHQLESRAGLHWTNWPGWSGTLNTVANCLDYLGNHAFWYCPNCQSPSTGPSATHTLCLQQIITHHATCLFLLKGFVDICEWCMLHFYIKSEHQTAPEQCILKHKFYCQKCERAECLWWKAAAIPPDTHTTKLNSTESLHWHFAPMLIQQHISLCSAEWTCQGTQNPLV